MLLGFRQHDIIPPMAQNFRLGDHIKINKFNDTLHTSFAKQDIEQNIHYIQNQDIYSLRTHLTHDFEILDE